MNVTSRITPSEMREAYFLNLSPALLLKLCSANFRLAKVFLIAIVGAVAISLTHQTTASKISSMLILVGCSALSLWLLIYSRASKDARAINKSFATYIFDAKGLTEQRADGSRSFVPWSAIAKWREGDNVFTVGGQTAFRAVSKSALGAVQIHELRSILQSQAHAGAPANAAFSRT